MDKQSKILVTGGTGFLGRNLITKLKEKGYEKIKVFSRHVQNRIEDVEYVQGDVRNKDEVSEAVKGEEVVYHLAAVLNENAPEELLWDVNVKGSKNVAEACIEKEVEKLIHVSSAGVLGETEEPADESSPISPETEYENSKAEAEKIIKRLIRKENLQGVIVRPAMVYGPNKYWEKIIKKAKEGFPLIGSGENQWHLLYIENAVEGLIKAGKNGKIGETYIIADDERKTYREIYKMICKNLSKDLPERTISPWLAKFMALFYKLKSKVSGGKPIVTPEHIKRLIRERKYSISKSKKILNYKPPYSVGEGIKKTVEKIGDKN